MTAVLVADDDRFAAEALRIQLARAGIAACTAQSGQEALAQFRACRPRVVLLDAAMPDMSGLEVCQRIRESGDGGGPAVIMVSGAATPSRHFVLRCAAVAGVDAFVAKPYDMTALIQLVRTHLAPAEATS